MDYRIVAVALACLTGCATTTPKDAATDVADPPDTIVFENVTVLPMNGNPELKSGRVVVRDAEIVTISAMQDTFVRPSAAVVINGGGGYLMPGIADMHVHYGNPDEGILYVANSVTTVRAPWGTELQFRLDADAKSGVVIGPHVYASGPLMDGPKPLWGAGSMKITSPDFAVGAVESQRASGFKAVKLYEGLTEPVYRAAVAAAKERDLQIWTHTPEEMTVEQVLALGVDSIEHMDNYQDVLMADDVEIESGPGSSMRRWEAADPAKMQRFAKITAEAGVWIAPTLSVLYDRYKHAADTKAFFDAPQMHVVNPGVKLWWASWVDKMTPLVEQATVAGASQRAFVKALYDAGAPLLIGTDNPNPLLVPGYSIHDELAAFVESGIPVDEVLRIATAEAARFLRHEGQFGVVAEGARADLILLDADPRDRLDTLRDPAGVMVNGRWVTREKIRSELEALAARLHGNPDQTDGTEN